MFTIEWKNKAAKQLRKLPRSVQEKIQAFVDSLRENPIPEGIKKMEGFESTYRKRLGTYRVVWKIQNNRLVVLVLKVGHRQGIYK